MQNTWLLFMTLATMIAPIIPYSLAVWGTKHRKNNKRA